MFSLLVHFQRENSSANIMLLQCSVHRYPTQTSLNSSKQSMDWKFQADRFLFTNNNLELESTPGQMNRGVAFSQNGKELFRAFALATPEYDERPDDTYLRGSDIFAAFESNDREVDCYWRLPSGEDESPYSQCVVLECIVSLRCSKLSNERIQCSLNVANTSPTFETSDNGTASRDPDSNTSWHLLVHPDDSSEVEFHGEKNGARIDIDIPWLERGVIRRIRLLIAVGKADVDAEEIRQIGNEFARSEIPLTT